MSKKKQPNEITEEQRQSRKEVLVARKEAQQTRQIRIAMGIVAGLILLVVVIALINELIISPNRKVATVEAQQIALKEFQDRVKFERAQRIVYLESQLESFGDVGIIQQFLGQMIVDLLPSSSETFGETILNQMVDETLIQQAAAERGITVSDEEVTEAIGADFGYFGGGLPTPLPTATQTVVPTPSLTPIPTAVITDVVPAATTLPTPTLGPTTTPFPTATPVSEEAFQQEFSDYFADFREFGVTDAQYREGVRLRLLRDKLLEALTEEQELSTQAEHANLFFIAFSNRDEAAETAVMIEEDGFLPVWNTIRSRPFDPESQATAVASELLQRTEADLSSIIGDEVATSAFALDLDTPSGVLTYLSPDGVEQYFIIMVSGREVLDLSDEAMLELKQEALANLLAEMRAGNVVLNDLWRGRVPTLPILDSKFLAEPTATPVSVLPTEQ
ncbi:MAG: SurA N-terminal domain-containing protein [Chloroflexota bacterium]